MTAKVGLTAALTLALGIGCSSDSDDVHLQDGTGAQGGASATGGTTPVTGGGTTGGASASGGATAGAGGAPNTCGDIVCGTDEECCGPPDCGHCIQAGTDPACAASCTSRACGDEGLECIDPVLGYPGEICVTHQRTAGPTVIVAYECVRDPCGTDPLDCTCAAEVCVDSPVPGARCMSPDPDALTLLCDDFEGICNSPDTPIATPNGDRPIASLQAGDLVYSVHEQAIVVVPVLRATRTAVQHHRVVRLETESGVVLEISPGHPTADGRSLGDLAPGDQLDGDRVASVVQVPYHHEHTYDVLPASDTGTYFAGGLRIGSTLGPKP